MKKGGTIILAASLSDGLGSPEFQKLMAENPDLAAFKKRILETDYFVMDQWQVEELAKVVARCKVKVVTERFFLRGRDAAPAVAWSRPPAWNRRWRRAWQSMDRRARVAVIPEKGPYVLPYVAA